MKRCFKCKTEKPLDHFYKHPQMGDGYLGDGYLNKCKECNKKDVRENYRKNLKHYILFDKKRNKTAHRKTQKAKDQRTRRKNNPLVYKANNMVKNAVRDGRLIKRHNCEHCGQSPTEGHHDDYTKPLSVVWLCRKCHKKVHGKTPWADIALGDENFIRR